MGVRFRKPLHIPIAPLDCATLIKFCQAVVILTIGSLGAGLATSLDMLIVFRAIQGIGGAGVYALPLTVIPEITPAESFGVVSAASGLVFTCSSIL
jgi:MFS family permease